MVYGTPNYWVSGLCPLFGNANNGKHRFSKTLWFLLSRIPDEGRSPETPQSWGSLCISQINALQFYLLDWLIWPATCLRWCSLQSEIVTVLNSACPQPWTEQLCQMDVLMVIKSICPHQYGVLPRSVDFSAACDGVGRAQLPSTCCQYWNASCKLCPETCHILRNGTRDYANICWSSRKFGGFRLVYFGLLCRFV
jgi:hypothetical protein